MKGPGVLIFLVLATAQVHCFTKQYLIVHNRLTWFQAYQGCLNRGLQMATINSPAEHEAYEAAVKRSGVEEWIWLGANDLAYENRFAWMSSGEEFTYSNWYPNQPDNYGAGEHCMGTWYFGKWNDFSCSAKMYYACEWKPDCSQGTVIYNPMFY